MSLWRILRTLFLHQTLRISPHSANELRPPPSRADSATDTRTPDRHACNRCNHKLNFIGPKLSYGLQYSLSLMRQNVPEAWINFSLILSTHNHSAGMCCVLHIWVIWYPISNSYDWNASDNEVIYTCNNRSVNYTWITRLWRTGSNLVLEPGVTCGLDTG